LVVAMESEMLQQWLLDLKMSFLKAAAAVPK